MVGIGKFFSSRTVRMKASEVRELLKWISGRKVISFGGGLPDPRYYPIDELAEIAREVIVEYKHMALQYGATEGLRELREELIEFSRKMGIHADSVDEILITTGSQQALDILGRIMIDPGDVVLVELPTYIAAINAFTLYEPKFVGIPMDGEGILIDALEETLREITQAGLKVKFLYTIPSCQNPTGISMSMRRREELLDLAEKYDFLIVEDNPYSYLQFEGEPLKPLKALDDSGRVVYLSTLSKILCPALRLGWVIADRDIVEKMALAKQSIDLCSSTLTQLIALEAIRRGMVDKYVSKVKPVYKAKRDLMLKALERYMPEGVTWTKPVGGMFIFTYLPGGVDTKALLPKAIERGVAYVPGRGFYVDGSGMNTMRLNYTYPVEEEIEVGVRVLSEVVAEALKA